MDIVEFDDDLPEILQKEAINNRAICDSISIFTPGEIVTNPNRTGVFKIIREATKEEFLARRTIRTRDEIGQYFYEVEAID